MYLIYHNGEQLFGLNLSKNLNVALLNPKVYGLFPHSTTIHVKLVTSPAQPWPSIILWYEHFLKTNLLGYLCTICFLIWPHSIANFGIGENGTKIYVYSQNKINCLLVAFESINIDIWYDPWCRQVNNHTQSNVQ